jgi:lipopolysaccharide biosynthesis protein
MNVAKARPWYPGHRQPHLPTELGFYDLRLPEVRAAQAALAGEHGIHGFIYYHYWFHGKRLLERPVADIVRSGEPDFPFCLCWANEPWTRSWTSDGAEILVDQRYSADDDLNHIRQLLPVFADRRYVKVDGKPVFFIYRISRLPDAGRTLDLWRSEAVRAGFPGIYFVRFEVRREGGEPSDYGADAAAEFHPDMRCLGREVPRLLPMRTLRRLRVVPPPFRAVVQHDYGDFVHNALTRTVPRYKYYRCAMPRWDNTPRRVGTSAWIAAGSTPRKYEEWLSGILARFEPYSADENFVIINAWNEWAEGNYLEPCDQWGREYLVATRTAIQGRR